MAKRVRPGSPTLAVAYLRVSTEDQALGPDAQRAAILAWASREGVAVVAWHVDAGVSGATPVAERSGLLAALGALRELDAGVLVAAKRDRLARDPVVAATVERAAAAAGAVVRTADGSSDAAGPEGMMMRGIVDVFAAYEREVIKARTRAALGVKKARGERVGAVPFGFRLAADGVHLEPHEDEQTIIARARELRADGWSLRETAAALEADGRRSRTGRPFDAKQVSRMVTTI